MTVHRWRNAGDLPDPVDSPARGIKWDEAAIKAFEANTGLAIVDGDAMDAQYVQRTVAVLDRAFRVAMDSRTTGAASVGRCCNALIRVLNDQNRTLADRKDWADRANRCPWAAYEGAPLSDREREDLKVVADALDEVLRAK